MLKKECPSSIPMDERSIDNDCYKIYLSQNNKLLFEVNQIIDNNFICREWVENIFKNEIKISISELSKYDLKIHHYYKHINITYDSWSEYYFRFINFTIPKLYFILFVSKLKRIFFTRKKIKQPNSYEILQLVYDLSLKYESFNIDSFLLMEKLFSEKWLYYSDSIETKRIIEDHLESWVASGDLTKKPNAPDYQKTVKTISTLERYKLEERKYSENIRMQNKVLWLNTIMLFFAVVQSKIITFPTIYEIQKTDLKMLTIRLLLVFCVIWIVKKIYFYVKNFKILKDE